LGSLIPFSLPIPAYLRVTSFSLDGLATGLAAHLTTVMEKATLAGGLFVFHQNFNNLRAAGFRFLMQAP
jgi:hypothetical protein